MVAMEGYDKIVAVGMVIRKRVYKYSTRTIFRVNHYRNSPICATTTMMQFALVCAIACMHSYAHLFFSDLAAYRCRDRSRKIVGATHPIATKTAYRVWWGTRGATVAVLLFPEMPLSPRICFPVAMLLFSCAPPRRPPCAFPSGSQDASRKGQTSLRENRGALGHLA